MLNNVKASQETQKSYGQTIYQKMLDYMSNNIFLLKILINVTTFSYFKLRNRTVILYHKDKFQIDS